MLHWFGRTAIVDVWTDRILEARRRNLAARELDIESAWDAQVFEKTLDSELRLIITTLRRALARTCTGDRVESQVGVVLERVRARLQNHRRARVKARPAAATGYLRDLFVPIEEVLADWESSIEQTRGSYYWHRHCSLFARATLDPFAFGGPTSTIGLAERVAEKAGIPAGLLHAEAMSDAIRFVQEERMAKRVGLEGAAFRALKRELWSEGATLDDAYAQGQVGQSEVERDRALRSRMQWLEDQGAGCAPPALSGARGAHGATCPVREDLAVR